MIKAEELRVGNKIVMHGVLHTVDLDLLTVIIHNDIHIEGLPLTPEILEAAGFVKCDALVYRKPFGKYTGKDQMYFLLWFHETEAMQAFLEYKVAEIQGVEFNTYNYIPGNLYYLHDLQNRFFSVTREELEINLTEVDTPAQLQ